MYAQNAKTGVAHSIERSYTGQYGQTVYVGKCNKTVRNAVLVEDVEVTCKGCQKAVGN